jgi:hypothetical protein
MVVGCGSGVSTTSTIAAPGSTATTLAPTTSTSTSTTTTAAPGTTSTTIETPTTTVPTGTTAVVAIADAVLGWWDGTSWVQAQSTVPVFGGETYQVLRLGSDPRTAVGSAPGPGCSLTDQVAITLDPAFRADDSGFDPFTPHEVAVTASWDVAPHPVSDTEPGADVVAAVSQALSGYGVNDPAPEFVQYFTADIDGDGDAEQFGVAERRSDPSGSLIPAQPGDYSYAFAWVNRGGDRQLATLGEWVVVAQPEGSIQDLVVYRFDALLDADADGVDEVAVRTSYYEGSGVSLWDYQGADRGFVDVIDAACGA